MLYNIYIKVRYKLGCNYITITKYKTHPNKCSKKEAPLDTNFWNNLILGRKYEEEVANFFESQGFNVWRLGGYRIPVDLFVWDDNKEFFIQVKFRSKENSGVNTWTLSRCIKGEEVDCFLIVINPYYSSVYLVRRDGTITEMWCPSARFYLRRYTNFMFFQKETTPPS